MEDKMHIIQNAIDLAHSLGIALPKVAILSGDGNGQPKVPSTVEAAALCKMADRGQITGGILDGPLALDNAIDLNAAKIKKIESPVAGDGRYSGRARSRSRQHAGQEPELHGRMLMRRVSSSAHACRSS
jgi:hypothetical protein